MPGNITNEHVYIEGCVCKKEEERKKKMIPASKIMLLLIMIIIFSHANFSSAAMAKGNASLSSAAMAKGNASLSSAAMARGNASLSSAAMLLRGNASLSSAAMMLRGNASLSSAAMMLTGDASVSYAAMLMGETLFTYEVMLTSNKSITARPQAPPAPPAPPAGGPLAYYLLTLHWPKSLCRQGKNCQNTNQLRNEFSIHGLWPKDMFGGEPSITSKEPFDAATLKSIKTELMRKWFNARDVTSEPTAVGFWSHEWKGHGIKSGLGLEDYFKTTMGLFDTVNSTYYSRVVGGKYPLGVLFAVSQFRNEFTNLGKPYVHCIGGTNELLELRFNVTLTASFGTNHLRTTDCPGGRALLPN